MNKTAELAPPLLISCQLNGRVLQLEEQREESRKRHDKREYFFVEAILSWQEPETGGKKLFSRKEQIYI